MQSNMIHNFARIPQANIERSKMQRNCSYKTTFNVGDLIPFYTEEYLPGDTFNVSCECFARLNTLLYPLMDNMYMDVHFFAVPNRLVYDNWQQMMGERTPNPTSSISYTSPQITCPGGGWADKSLADYFGIRTGIPNLDFNAYHTRAYNLIYNEWYRSTQIQDSVKVDTGAGPDTDTDYVVLKRGKRHDYLTSALPYGRGPLQG